MYGNHYIVVIRIETQTRVCGGGVSVGCVCVCSHKIVSLCMYVRLCCSEIDQIRLPPVDNSLHSIIWWCNANIDTTNFFSCIDFVLTAHPTPPFISPTISLGPDTLWHLWCVLSQIMMPTTTTTLSLSLLIFFLKLVLFSKITTHQVKVKCKITMTN